MFSETENSVREVFSFSHDCQCFYFHMLEKCLKYIFLQNGMFSVWVLPLLFPLFPFCTFGTGRRQNTFFLHSISFFCSAFFPYFLQYPQNINGTFCSGTLSRKKCQRILKIWALLLFLMLETELICQIGCNIRLWFQHNGEIINRIMDGKQEVFRVCFSVSSFQISQAECNTVSVLEEERLAWGYSRTPYEKKKEGCSRNGVWNTDPSRIAILSSFWVLFSCGKGSVTVLPSSVWTSELCTSLEECMECVESTDTEVWPGMW